MRNNNAIDTYIKANSIKIKKILTKEQKYRILQKFDFEDYAQVSTIIQRTNQTTQYVFNTIIYRQDRLQLILV